VTGPLAGVTVIEVASIGPGPFCSMVLADMGAEVVRIERLTAVAPDSDPPPDPLQRGRSASIGVDLKHPEGPELLLRLVDGADVLVEGFRPGVMERLGVGPDVCLARNPGLVYGRITGWGQDGPLAERAGHDIDYLAVAGVLHPIGDADRPPPPPLNLVGDFGGGGMLLAFGIAAALFERERSGRGQVIDAAMTDGSSLLVSLMHGLRATGMWSDERAANLLDGGAPFYRSYETSDGRYMAVGAIEPQFYEALLAGLGLADEDLPGQYDRSAWPSLHERFADAFRSASRAEWTRRFAGTDACVAPVNDLGEAIEDPHMAARMSFVEVAGIAQPSPAPRFSRTAVPTPSAPRPPGADTETILRGLGMTDDEIARLRIAGVIGQYRSAQ
jgi:alpha-methylacyl-CoA racemase